MTVAFVGLSHLGLVSSVCMAAKGVSVLGLDPDPALIEELNKGNLIIEEPGLAETLNLAAGNISFSSDLSLVAGAHVIYVALDVPTNSENVSDTTGVKALCSRIAEHASIGTVIVIHSQVSPGFTRSIRSFFDSHYRHLNLILYYQVETLVFGNAVHRASYPERYIVGTESSDSQIDERLKEILEVGNCSILEMNYESAELAKIAINLFLASSLCTTNLVAEVCERIGADWRDVAGALKLDKRIGSSAYLSPGLGISGGNIERDLKSICKIGEVSGSNTELVNAWMRHLKYRRAWVLKVLNSQVLNSQADPLVAVWGLAYKPNTHSTKNSPSIELISQLRDIRLRVHDPCVRNLNLSDRLTQFDNPLECLNGADAVVVMTPWPVYEGIDIARIYKSLNRKIIIDPFGLLRDKVGQFDDLQYFSLGAI